MRHSLRALSGGAVHAETARPRPHVELGGLLAGVNHWLDSAVESGTHVGDVTGLVKLGAVRIVEDAFQCSLRDLLLMLTS